MGKPIHIMSFAPADYVNDPAVKLALARRDHATLSFYHLFLFHSFIQGGSLSSDPAMLAVILGMKPAEVSKAVTYWTEHGKLTTEAGRLYHRRVQREVSEAVARREADAERKKRERNGGSSSGGCPADVHGTADGFQPPSGAPLPLPLPLPSAVPLPDRRNGPSDPPRAFGQLPPEIVGDRTARERNVLRLLRDLVAIDADLAPLEKREPRDAPRFCSDGKTIDTDKRIGSLNPADWTDKRLVATEIDLQANLERLRKQLTEARARHG